MQTRLPLLLVHTPTICHHDIFCCLLGAGTLDTYAQSCAALNIMAQSSCLIGFSFSHNGKLSVIPGGRLHDPFSTYALETREYGCCGHLLRIPAHGGHWIAIVKPTIGDYNHAAPDAHFNGQPAAALLCDSLYPSPFLISAAELEQLLTVCAMESSSLSSSQFQGNWGCFLVGDGYHLWW